MYHTLDDHGIDDVSNVVDGDVLLELDLPGIAVDLDNGDVSAEGPGEVLRVEYADCFQSWFGALWQALIPVGS